MIGDSGQNVVAVKQRLYELGYVDTEDGGFDEAMEAGVKEFQAANNLSVDGKVGITYTTLIVYHKYRKKETT